MRQNCSMCTPSLSRKAGSLRGSFLIPGSFNVYDEICNPGDSQSLDDLLNSSLVNADSSAKPSNFPIVFQKNQKLLKFCTVKVHIFQTFSKTQVFHFYFFFCKQTPKNSRRELRFNKLTSNILSSLSSFV